MFPLRHGLGLGLGHGLRSVLVQNARHLTTTTSARKRWLDEEVYGITARQSNFPAPTVLASTSPLPSPTPSRVEISPEEQEKMDEVISLVDAQITSRSYGRLFAAVYFDGEQRKFSVGDLIMVNKDIAIDVGQQITLDKVTLVGGKDFTLIGRPVLPRDLVRVEATVVEKNLSRTNVLLICKKKPSRGQYKFIRDHQTTLRINRIDLLCPLEETTDRVGFEARSDNPIFT